MPQSSFFSGLEVVVMLKEAIIDVIHESLSDYFETLDTSQLSISLWAGDVALHDLQIKTTAIEGITALPVKVVAGKIGKFTIKIPWASLFRSAVELSISELYLLLIPSYAEYDKETEERISLTIKKNIVQRFEDSYKEYVVRRRSGESDDSYKDKLTVQIIRNLQIKLESIHIRYEDNITQDDPVSVGILLKSLSIQATDENWKPVYISQVMDTMFKHGTLEDFSFYWNVKANLISTTETSKEDIMAKLKDLLTNDTSLSHVIGPIKAEMKLTYTPDSEKTEFQWPQIDALVIFSELSLGINQTQLKDAIRIADTLRSITRSQHYKQYKPINLKLYKGNYKKWWKFAYYCILEDVRRRRKDWKWKNMKIHRKLLKMYMDAYHKKSAAKTPTKELTEEANRIEKSLDVFNIILARKLVQLRLKRLERAEASRKPSWLLGLFSNSRLSTEEVNKVIADEWTPEEKTELKEVLDFREDRRNSITYPDDYEIMRLNFRISKLLLTLSELSSYPPEQGEGEEDVVLKMNILEWGTKIARRPVNDGFKFDLTLGTVEAQGIQSKYHVLSNCYKECHLQTEVTKNVLEFTFEEKPVDSSADRKIKLVAQPLQLIYHYPTIQTLLDRFVAPQIGQPDTIAATKLEELKKFSAEKIQQLIKNRAEMELTVDCLAPYILIPRDGDMKKNTTVLGVDLGKLTIKSENRLSSRGGGSSETGEEKSFDSYSVKLEDFQVFLALPGELYEYHSLTKTNQVVSYEKMVLTAKSSRIKKSHVIPSLKIEANIPIVNIEIGQQRFLEMVLLMIKLPLPHMDKSHGAKHTSSVEKRLNATQLISGTPSNTNTIHNEKGSQTEEKDQLQFIDIAFDARVDSIQIKLNQDEKKLLTWSITNLTAKVVSMTYSDEFEFATDCVTLSILGHKIPGRKGPLYLIYTVSKDKSEPPVKIRLSSVASFCPGKYLPPAVDAFSFHLSSVDFTFHQEALSTILKFIDGFQNAELNSTLEELHLPASKKRLSAAAKIEVKLRVEIHLELLAIHLAAETKNIAKFILQGLHGIFEETLSSLSVVSSLKKIVGYPAEPHIPYQKILVVEGGNVFTASILVNKDSISKPKSPNQHDLSINVRVGSMFAIIVPQFIVDIKEFAELLRNCDAGDSPSRVERLKRLALAHEQNPKKILLNIQIEPPRIAFPRAESSSDAILVNLGKLSFMNEFVPVKSKNEKAAVLDEIDFHLRQAKISRISIDFETQNISAEVYLLNPISFQCKVARNLSPCLMGQPNTRVVIRLQNNVLRMDIEDYRIWRNILRHLAAPVVKQQKCSCESKSAEPPLADEPQTSSPTSSAACEDFSAEVFLQNLGVFLYDKVLILDEKHGVVVRDPEDSFAFFSLTEIKAYCKIWSNSDISAALTVGNVVLEDTRKVAGSSSDTNKPIIIRNPPYTSGQPGVVFHPFLKLTYNNGSNWDANEANTNLELPAISINMYSQFLSEVYKFFTVD